MGKIRAVTTVAAIAVVILAVIAVLLRHYPVTGFARLWIVVWAPYIAVLSGAAAVVIALRCKPIAAAAAVAVAVIAIGTQVSWYGLGRSPDIRGPSAEIRVLSVNIRNGEADPAALVELAERSADVITVSELTEQAVRKLSAIGIGRRFPYSHLVPAPMAGGVGMWSRYPLSALTVPEHPAARVPAARIEIPGVRLKPLLAGVHVKSPRADGQDTVADWSSGMDYLKQQLDRFATAAGPGAVIVAGDFNGTPDARQFRGLLDNGYGDAVHLTRAGFGPTFPADRRYPPLIVIDHVLTRNATPTSVRTVRVAGSDHRGLIAALRIPIDPSGR